MNKFHGWIGETHSVLVCHCEIGLIVLEGSDGLGISRSWKDLVVLEMCFEASWKVVLAFSLQKKGAHNRFIFIFFWRGSTLWRRCPQLWLSSCCGAGFLASKMVTAVQTAASNTAVYVLTYVRYPIEILTAVCLLTLSYLRNGGAELYVPCVSQHVSHHTLYTQPHALQPGNISTECSTDSLIVWLKG